MTNEQLAHELLLDPTFQLSDDGYCSSESVVFHRIRESFHQAFWDSLVDDLKLDTPCFVRVLRVLGEISDGISDLAGSREAGSIKEIVDLVFIRQQAEAGLYCWSSCLGLVSGIVEVVQRVQAPKRDEETKTKWGEVSQAMQRAAIAEHPRQLCKALEFLLDRVNAMRIDAANARLRLISGVVKDHGVDYERGKFQDKLTEGTVTEERTKEWIGVSLRNRVASKKIALGDLIEGKPKDFIEVHSAGMIALVSQLAPIKADIIPETLVMDSVRLAFMQREFTYLASASAVFATASHYKVVLLCFMFYLCVLMVMGAGTGCSPESVFGRQQDGCGQLGNLFILLFIPWSLLIAFI